MVEQHILDTLTSRQRETLPARPTSGPATRGSDATKGGKRGKKAPRAGRNAAPSGLDTDLRRDLAHAMVRCTSFYMLDMQEELIEQSAAFLDALGRVWASRGVDPQAVWREIDHRVQLGNLLNRLNRDIPLDAETTRRYWRPSSTKLP